LRKIAGISAIALALGLLFSWTISEGEKSEGEKSAANLADSNVVFRCDSGYPRTKCSFVVWDDRPSQLGALNFILGMNQTHEVVGAYRGAKYCVVDVSDPIAPSMTYPDCFDHPKRGFRQGIVTDINH
jgi:hypothetical protein